MNSSTYSPNTAAAASINSSGSAAAATATKVAGRVEDTADVLRDKVADTVQQLSRGWKGLTNLKNQVKRHPLATILSSTAVLLAIGGSITVGVLESQRRRTFSYRFKKGLRNVKRQMMR